MRRGSGHLREPSLPASSTPASGPRVIPDPSAGATRLDLAFRAVEAFPALRQSREGVAAALEGPAPDGAALVAAIGSDLGLAIPVLREAVRVGGPEHATSVAAAVDRLGPDALRGVCAAVASYDVLGTRDRWDDAPDRFLRHAVGMQRAVRWLAGAAHRADGEVLVTAALLRDIGMLALAHADGRPGEPFTDRRRTYAASERQPTGLDHAAVSGALLRRWGLARPLWGLVERHGYDDPHRGLAILRLADLVARHDHGDAVDRGTLLRVAGAAGIDEDALRALLYDQAAIVVGPRRVAPCPLTPAELEALRGLARGLRYKEIAAELGVQATTIGSHLHKVYAKTGTADRAQAVLLATERGWLDR